MNPTEPTAPTPSDEQPYVMCIDPGPDEAEVQEILKAAAIRLQQINEEGRKAGDEGLAAMERIAAQIVGGDNSQAVLMRSFLLSIFGKVEADLSQVGRLDWDLRKDLCAVILGVNHGRFDDFKIREILISAGDYKAKWFFAGVPEVPAEQ